MCFIAMHLAAYGLSVGSAIQVVETRGEEVRCEEVSSSHAPMIVALEIVVAVCSGGNRVLIICDLVVVVEAVQDLLRWEPESCCRQYHRLLTGDECERTRTVSMTSEVF